MSKRITFGKGEGTGYANDGKEWDILADGEPVGLIESHKDREFGFSGPWLVRVYTVSVGSEDGYCRAFEVGHYDNARQAFAAAKDFARAYFAR